MTNFKRQIFSALAAGAMVLNLATPAFAGTTIEISGNGSESDNDVSVRQDNDTTVNQTNVADIKNNISVSSNTGGNEAEGNTGGNVTIDTGNAKTNVTVNNTVNTNHASVDCCPQDRNTNVTISGNGSESDNEVKLREDNDVNISQLNDANVRNKIDVDSNTGDNDAEDNTGGNVTIKTGDARTTVRASTTANANVATVGNDSSNGGSVSARILGNGEDSDNEIKLRFDNDVTLSQWNVADIKNKIDVDTNTGDNEAEDNTGGSILIDTGDATTRVYVDNMANFNVADVDCGCVLGDVLAKISGNGEDSDNEIKLRLDNDVRADQGNVFDCDGRDGGWWDWWRHNRGTCATVDVDSNTGDNEAEDNTAQPNGDPSIETGEANTTVNVNNSGNSNSFGVDLSDLHLPHLGGLHFSFTFDLEDLLSLLPH